MIPLPQWREYCSALAIVRVALGAPAPPPASEEAIAERILRLTGVDVRRCPHCGATALICVGRLVAAQTTGPPG